MGNLGNKFMIKIMYNNDARTSNALSHPVIFVSTVFIVKPLLPVNSLTDSILCLIDFSEDSIRALRWTAGIAMSLHAHMTIVHPYRLVHSDKKEDLVQAKKELDMKAANNFEKIALDIFKDGTVTYDFRPEVGFIYDRVRDHSRRNKILFVAIEKKFALNKKEALDELIEQIEVPLVIIP